MNSTRRARRAARELIPLAVIAALTAVLFSPVLFQGKVFLAADAVNAFYPWRSFGGGQVRPHNTLITDPLNHNYAEIYNRDLKSGGLSRWQPYILTGLPATEVTGQCGSPGRYSPLKLLAHRLLPTLTATMALFIANILLMGCSMYLYLREIRAGRRGALFGAVVYMFNGSAMVWLEFESVPATSALFPLLFLLMERFRGRSPWVAAFAGALALGTLTLMGQMQYVLYTAFLMLCYLAFLLLRLRAAGAPARTAGRVVGCFAVMAAGGMAIAAVQMLPMAELMRESQRINRDFDFDGYFSTLSRVPYRYYITLLFPDFFGGPHLGVNVIPRLPTQEYMNYNELCLYMGVPAVFALGAALCARWNAHLRFHLAVAALIGSFLSGAWLYYPLFLFFPGMDRMNPSRMTFLFVFAFAAAAGLGVSRLGSLHGRRRTAFVGLSGTILAAVALTWLLGGRPGALALFDREIAAAGGEAVAAASALLWLRQPSSAVMVKPLLLAIASAACLAGCLFLRGRRRAAAHWLLLGVAAADLISFGRAYNTVSDPSDVYRRTPAIDYLLKQPGPFRVVQDAGRGLFVNTLVPFGLEEVGGYSSFYPARTNLLLSSMTFGADALRGRVYDRWVTFGADARLFDLLNVRYLLTAPGAPVRDPKYRLVFRGDLDVHENTRALPRAFVVHRSVTRRDIGEILGYLHADGFDPAAEVVLEEDPDPGLLPARPGAAAAPPRVAIERHAADEVVVTATLAAPGWLVLTDAWYPGWRATVDGREARILRADANYRAVPLAPGAHRVVFAYNPASWRWGMLISGAGWLLACVGLGATWWRARGLGSAGAGERRIDGR